MITYNMLSREKIEVFRGYLTQEAYDRRTDQNVFYYGASTETEIVGVAAFEAGAESELLSIAVSPDWQRKGIGSELVDQIGDLLFAHGMAGLQAFLSGTEEEREGLDHFLWRCGFQMEEEVPAGSFTLKEAQESEVMKKAAGMKKAPGVKRLSEIEPIQAKEFGRFLGVQGLYTGWETGNLEEACSSVYLENGEIKGCVLIKKEEDGLELSYVYIAESCKDSVAMIRLLAFSMEQLAERYPLETRISTVAVNPAAEKILIKILGESMLSEDVCRYVLPFSMT